MTDTLIRIEKLAFGGNGVGRINGKVCFVPLSCPGDELLVRITAEKRSYLTAGIVDIIVPSPHRVLPGCPLFGSCGGCGWQHIAYAQQLEAKRQILAESLWRGARVTADHVEEIVPSPVQYNYRSRVQFKLHNSAGGLQIGFYRRGSHYVENAQEGCAIALPLINQVLLRFREVLELFPEPTAIPQININTAEEGAVAIIHYTGRDQDGVSSFFNEHHASLEPLTGLYLRAGRKPLRYISGNSRLVYSMPGNTIQYAPCSLAFRPGGFSQVNCAQNREILKLVRRLACCGGSERLLDLYCGNGNFSLPLAGDVASITGIEENEDSIIAAIDNGRRNGIHNAEFICADAVAGVRHLADDDRCFDVVILDPPRCGAAEVLSDICRLKPSRIVYISCDPSTLARDCGLLAAKGFSVQVSVPVDMFPQTYHLESVTLLLRG